MEEKCFAVTAKRKCKLLKCGECSGNYDRCPFYKPRWMADRDTRKRLYRISQLPEEQQAHIAQRYYHGKMPWKGITP